MIFDGEGESSHLFSNTRRRRIILPLRQPTPAGRIPPFMFDSWYELLSFLRRRTPAETETEHTYKESRCVTL